MRSFWYVLTFTVLLVFSVNQQISAQNCTSFFGQSGVPAGGTNYFLCTVPGTTLLDATNTQGNPSSYTWSTGATTPTITVTNTGTFTVTVGSPQHPSACVLNFSVQLTNPMQPGLGNDTAICTGDTLNLGSNFIYATYNWSTGDTTDTLLASLAGTYMLTVQDNNGCSASDTITITNDPLPTFTLYDDTICSYDSLTISPSITTYESYLWSTGDTTPTITESTPGTYQLTVTDSNSCSSADTMVLANFPTAITNLGTDYSICPGDTTTLTPGNYYSSYTWSNSSSDDSILVSSSGNYWVETTDTNGCISEDTIIISTYTVNKPALGNDTSFCESDTLTLDAGTGYVSYTWNSGETTQNIDLLSPGTYSVTVIDANGCESSDTIVTTNYPIMNINSIADTACVGDTITLEVTSGYSSYQWSNGDSNYFTQTTVAGSYQVTITDVYTCESITFVNASNYTTPTPNIGLDDTLCYGLNKTLDAGNGYSSYSWSNGTSMQTASFDTTGSYWVEVSDINGCRGSDSINLVFELGPTITLNNDTTICLNDSVTITANANAVSYFWSTGETTPSIIVNSGQYNVSVTGNNGCISVDSVVISTYSLPNVNIGNDIYYCENTTFTQPIDAGSGFVSYSWMNGSNAQVILADQNMDTVWVEVVDANTCVNSDTIYVIENASPTLNLGANDSVCSGLSRVINSNASPSAVTSYLWNTTDTTGSILYTAPLNITTPTSADYSITITDTNSCTNSDTITITAMPLPTPDLGADTAYCFGDNFTTTLDPGNFSTYSWSTGDITQTIVIGAFDSAYSVTVTDTSGCSNSDYIFVSENQLPSPDLGNDTSYCEGVNFAIVLNPGGYQGYLWSTGNTDPYQLVTSGGTYEVTVTDANGCENTDDLTVTMNPKPLVDLGGDITLCEDSVYNYVIDASTQLPSSGYSYSWTTGSNLSTIYVTDFGYYSVTVTNNASGCVDSSDVELIPFSAVQVSLGEDGIICENTVLTITPEVSADSGYTYNWSNGASTKSIQINASGEYWVELNAINGTCVGRRDTVEYTQAVMPVLELGPDQQSCLNDPIILKNTLVNTDTSVTYLWQDTIPLDSITVYLNGTYRATAYNVCGTVTDEVNVSFIDCYQVYVPNSFTPNDDGLNDTFKPYTDQEVTEYFFQIFNRWGEVVFKTSNIDAAWDGTVSGKPAPNDVYVWKLSFISAYDPYLNRREDLGKVVLSR